MNILSQELVLKLLKKILPLAFIAFLPFSYSQNDFASDIEKKIKAKGLKKSSLGLAISKIQKNNNVIPLYSLNGESAVYTSFFGKNCHFVSFI